jgi:hypothetical protein
MALFGTPRATHYYPSISYGTTPTVVPFDDPVETMIIPETVVAGNNISSDGTREVLVERTETTVVLRFRYLQVPMLKTLYAWWNVWGKLGKQSVLTLDRNTPTALTAAQGAAGNVNVGTHSYKTTFIFPGGGETVPGLVSNVVNVAGVASQVNLTAIPLGPSGATTRKIYRTVAGDTGAYKLALPIAHNTATTATDDVADGSLGAVAPTVSTTGQWEYDQYNTFFSKAELVSATFAPTRSLFSRALFSVELIFRQGS